MSGTRPLLAFVHDGNALSELSTWKDSSGSLSLLEATSLNGMMKFGGETEKGQAPLLLLSARTGMHLKRCPRPFFGEFPTL